MGGQCDAETLAHPSANFLDEEALVRREPALIEAGYVLLEPPGFIGQPMDADDHRGPRRRRVKGTAQTLRCATRRHWRTRPPWPDPEGRTP